MMSTGVATQRVQRLAEALQAQQQALLGGDPLALAESAARVANALEDWRGNAPIPQTERDALAGLRTQLTLNAGLLERAAAGNQRALAVLFEPSATYTAPGGQNLSRPSRALVAA